MNKFRIQAARLRFVVLFSSAGLSACTYQLPAIEAKKLFPPNPTSYVFSAPIQKVREQIDMLCTQGYKAPRTQFDTPTSRAISSCIRYVEGLKPIQPSGLRYQYTPGYRPELQIDEVRMNGRSITDDWFVSNYYSRTYHYVGGNACPVVFSILLRTEALEEQKTRVSVSVTSMSTVKGYYPGIHGAKLKEYTELAPTSIEEYEILLHIGMRLGEPNMPVLRTP